MHQRNGYLAAVVAAALAVLSLPAEAANLTRGPYLQQATPDSVIVIWRTDEPTDSIVRYGTDPAALTQSKLVSPLVSQHEVRLTGLSSSTRYYYAIGSSFETFADGAEFFFETALPLGTQEPVRIWVLGDSGLPGPDAAAVRDAMISEIAASGDLDLWMMLGDNAYDDGLDSELQAAVFDMYPSFLRNRSLWPAFGNHDAQSADSTSQSGPYYDVFVLPKAGEAGGSPSGTEAYYSFDFANVHFICLDSEGSPRGATEPMLEWALADAAATEQDWIIAFWHHPPYSKGGIDSDVAARSIEMRENALPILEAAGVDLVLSGHSHSYQRSFLVGGAFDTPTTAAGHIRDGGDGQEDGDGAYVKAGGDGTIYVVAGSSSRTSGGPFDHPLMYTGLAEHGSLVLDIDGGRLDAFFLNLSGGKPDDFTILKNVPPASGLNHLPIAIDQSFEIDKDMALAFGLEATDPDGDPLTYSVVGPAANGTLDGSLPAITYIPDPDFVGVDTFTYKAADGQGDSNTATVAIQVGSFIDLHVIQANDDAEESSSGSVNLTSSDLELVQEGSNQIVGIRFQGVPIPRGADVRGAYLQFTVDEVSTAPTSLTIAGHDVGDSPAFASVSQDVSGRPLTSFSAAWDPPAWSSVGESGPGQRSPDISAVIEEIVGRPDWLPDNSLSLIIAGVGKRVAESYHGSVVIAPRLHVEWDDPGPQANQPPLASDLSVGAVVDTPVAIQLEAFDPDGDPLSYVVVTSPANGTLSGSAPNLTYTPDPAFVGMDGFTFTANDGEFDSNVANVSIEVTDPPEFFVFEARVSTGSDDAEERPNGTVNPRSSDLELVHDGGDQTVGIRFQEVSIPQGAAILEAYLQFQVDEASAEPTSLTIRGHATDHSETFTNQENGISTRPGTTAVAGWSPAAWTAVGEAGADQRSPDISAVIQEIVDRPGWTGENALSILVTGTGERVAEAYNGDALGAPLLHVEWSSSPLPNQPPSAEDLAGEAQSGVPLDIALVASDPEGSALTWEITSAPANGTLTGAAPDVTYTSDAGFLGADFFTFKVNDGELDSNEATVAITVVEASSQSVFETRVAQSSDDAEESASGSVNSTSSDLELVEEGGSIQTVGIRFLDVTIPQGAVVTSAFVQFTVDETSSGVVSLVIRGHGIGHSETFVAQTNDISQRAPTVASTGWSPPAWSAVGEAGESQRTPDLSAIVQEIVGQPDWASGNALTLIMTGAGKRVAESYNGDSARGPLLHVEWE